MGVLGLGHDVTDVVAFGAQLSEPGSRMRNLFSARELRQASLRAASKGDVEALHLAAKWAGKEAVLKAWDAALGSAPSPYTLDDFPWARVEILDDHRGRPHVVLADDVAQTLTVSLAGAMPPESPASESLTHAATAPVWHISLSHDGPVASAVAVLCV